MKRGLILASLLSILCASCISGPHYWLDPTDPFRPERSGRLMKITPGLVGLPVAALHDQIESLFYLDPWHFMWTPICSLWLAVSIPAYDIICLPRDLYLRNFAGLEVFVCHPDGTPIRNANILAYEKEAWIERKIGFFETDSRGLAYIPRKSSLVRIKRVDFSEEDSGKPFWMAFEKSSTRFGANDDENARTTIVRFESGTSYAPITRAIDMAIPIDEENNGSPWRFYVDLATATIERRPITLQFRQQYNDWVRIDWGGSSLTLDFPFFGGSLPFVMVNQPEEFRVSGSGSTAFLSDENKQRSYIRRDMAETGEISAIASSARKWAEKRASETAASEEEDTEWRSIFFPRRIRKGLSEGQRILFKVGGRYGLLTAFYIEYGGDLPDPVLHMRWMLNVEPGKDWFDMNGTTIKVVSSPEHHD